MRIAYFNATYYNTRRNGGLTIARRSPTREMQPASGCGCHGFRSINGEEFRVRIYMAATREAPIADAPPDETAVTVYDRDHLKLYVRLLDAEKAGAPLEEVSSVLLGIDARTEPERARRVHERHLSRARWMTEHGYRDLLKSGLPQDARPQ
jgi:hypothetical protein